MSNRLQFVHCDTLFKTRDEAIKYVVDSHTGIRPSLYAEPMILKYGDENTPNIILAIGSVGNGTENRNNQTFFIDFAKIEDSIKDINETISKNEVNISNIQTVLNSVISSIGLTENGDGVIFDNQIINKSDNIIKALNTLSDYVSNLEKRYNLITDNSKTISHELTTTDDGIKLVSNVNLHENIIVGGKEYENIIIEKDNGLFSYVNVEYNEDTKDLSVYINNNTPRTFTLDKNINIQSGLYDKNDDEIILTLTDGTHVSIDTSELINTIKSNNVNTPIELTIESDGSKRIIKADVNISEDQHALFNILRKDERDNSLRVDGTAKNIMYQIGDDDLNKDSYKSVQETINDIYRENTKLSNAIQEVQTASQVTITPSTPDGVLKRYTFTQGDTELGVIDLAKDLFVTKAEIIVKEGEKYLQLTIANQETPIEIKVSDLVDAYIGSTYVDIDTNNIISVKFDKLANALVGDGTSVANAIKANANAIKANADAIKEEGIRAKDVEGGLKTRLAYVEADYLTSEDRTTLNGLIGAEKQRAEGVEENISNQITNLNSRMSTLEKDNSENVIRFENISNGLIVNDKNVNVNISIKDETKKYLKFDERGAIELNGVDSAISTSINGERKRAESAENTLTESLKVVTDDYLKSSHEIELKGLITAEKQRAEGVEDGLNTRLEDVEDDYLKGADKEELNSLITNNTKAIEKLNGGIDVEGSVKYSVNNLRTEINSEIVSLNEKVDKASDGLTELKPFTVDNTEKDITLTNRLVDGKNVLSAKVRISTRPKNILKIDGDYLLYVDGTADNIQLADGRTVEQAIQRIDDIEKIFGDKDSAIKYVNNTLPYPTYPIPGLILSVVNNNDTSENGAYFVESVLDETKGTVGEIERLAKVSELEKNTESINETINTTKTELSQSIDTEVNTINTKITNEVNTINNTINNVKSELQNSITTNISEVNQTISEVNQTISDKEKSLNDRVDSEVNTLNGKITNVNATISTIQTDISGINTDIEGINTDIEGINTDINGINSNIEGINSNINSINETLSNGQIEIDCGEY